MTRYVGTAQMRRILEERGVERVIGDLVEAIDAEFRRWDRFEKVARCASHSELGVIELMPASDGELYAFKYVNGHPFNTASGLLTVTGLGVLADVATGYPLLVGEMTALTALRTAATSALAARHLARRGSETMAIVGLGAQSEFQALAFRAVLGVERLRIHDRDPEATLKFVRNMEGRGLRIEPMANVAEAVAGADIVTTSTADKRHARLVSADMLEPGQHVNAIGGDCPGKTELDESALRLGRIFVEFEPQTRIEGDIQLLSTDHPVTELWKVIVGTAEGRSNPRDVTIFDSVGFAVEDFAALKMMHAKADAFGLPPLDVVPEVADPKDLFGCLTAGRTRRRGGTEP